MSAARRCLLILAALLGHARTQVVWTPIYLDGSSQVDLWTQASTGCSCPFEPSRDDCACCVPEGGCHCGLSAPHRCAQCGLEQHCANMCNVTIDSRVVSADSGRLFGQIKSPAAVGPTLCWYLLKPQPGQRVELQVYRLVGAGRFDGQSCRSGSLQLMDGTDPRPDPTNTQVCGVNERYDPPVVLFADKGDATLLFSIGEWTARSQFLAYFSFTPRDGGLGTGFQPRGGQSVEDTDCDWLYNSSSCHEPGSCILASPGYPGLYPPRRTCHYLITLPPDMLMNIVFISLLLPHNRCGTDYIAVFQGPTSSSPLLTTICANKKMTLTHTGSQLLLKFSSGPSLPPYNYNGFLASVQFKQAGASTETSQGVYTSSESRVMMDGMVAPMSTAGQPSCELVFRGNSSRSGHLNSRDLPSATTCTLTFIGQNEDTVHITLLAFKLSPASCASVIEIFDGFATADKTPMVVICSPDTKQAQDGAGRYHQQQSYTSTNNVVTVVMKLSARSNISSDMDFLEVAYSFHAEQDASCDTAHYGSTAPRQGHVTSPVEVIAGPLQCSHRFIPAVNQSVTIKVTRLGGQGSGSPCHTQCGDGGCQCVAGPRGLSWADHIVVAAEGGLVICCLCGDFQQEWLPVSVRSWSPVKVVYFVVDDAVRFSFHAEYSFHDEDDACGHHKLPHASGVVRSRGPVAPPDMLNHFQYLDCSWLLESYTERQLTVEVETNQSRACTAWNITLHALDGIGKRSDNRWQTLHRFCPRDRYRRYSLPWDLNTVLLRLRALTRVLPEYVVRWRSQAVLANTRVSGPIPDPPTDHSTAPSCFHLGWAIFPAIVASWCFIIAG